MPITRTYGPSAGLVADLGYSAGSNMQQTEDLMAMLQLLAGVNSTALNDKQQTAALAHQNEMQANADAMAKLEMLGKYGAGAFNVFQGRTAGSSYYDSYNDMYKNALTGVEYSL